MRLRVKFSKLGKVRFTSHRDVARIWERTIRRANVPVKYSEGFSPRPRLAFGLALSTGHESLAEYLDIDLETPEGAVEADVDPEEVANALDGALPAGFEVQAAAVVASNSGSLQQIVTSSSWLIELPEIDQPVARAAVDRLLAAETVVVTRERKGKPVEDDLRPAVFALDLVTSTADGPSVTTLEAELGTQPRALRPSELLDALGFPGADARVRRTHQWIQDGDARREPLPSAPSAVSSRAAARDSRRESTDVRSTGHRPPDTVPDGAGHATPGASGASSVGQQSDTAHQQFDAGSGLSAGELSAEQLAG